jgi:hypothetical protein
VIPDVIVVFLQQPRTMAGILLPQCASALFGGGATPALALAGKRFMSSLFSHVEMAPKGGCRSTRT